MDSTWPIQQAADHLYDLIQKALHHEIQIIELEDNQKVLVIAMEDFKKAVKPKNSLASFFADSPVFGLPLDLDRIRTDSRNIDL